MLEALHSEMSELFSAFLPPELASRFTKLLALNPKRWEKIDPWRVWSYVDSLSIIEWKGDDQGLLASSQISKFAASTVTVLRCGHDSPSIERLSLHDALVGNSPVFEGFISVVPGKLGLAINHDGMLCILSKERSNHALKTDAESPRAF